MKEQWIMESVAADLSEAVRRWRASSKAVLMKEEAMRDMLGRPWTATPMIPRTASQNEFQPA
jgi:hypothetical protein